MPARPRFRAFLRSRSGDAEAALPAAPRARRRPPPATLRRERRALLRLREERIRDLGGLVLEMFRQDSFRETLLFERAAEIATMEERLRELDLLLDGRRPYAARCLCGAPLLAGSHFCANCGRPVAAHAGAGCAACGHALAADASFCPACATPVEAAAAAPQRASDAT